MGNKVLNLYMMKKIKIFTFTLLGSYFQLFSQTEGAKISSLSSYEAKKNLIEEISYSKETFPIVLYYHRGSSSTAKNKVVKFFSGGFLVEYLYESDQTNKIDTVHNFILFEDEDSAVVNIKKGKSIIVKFKNGYFEWNNSHDANTFANAFNTLKHTFNTGKNSADLAETEKFKKEAEAFRLLTVKPSLPEETRKYIKQADLAMKEKSYDEAIDLFQNAIKTNSTYPDAYFNLSLLFAQKFQYEEAILEMKKYLLLIPEAKDARSSQDKIYEWERQLEKINKKLNEDIKSFKNQIKNYKKLKRQNRNAALIGIPIGVFLGLAIVVGLNSL